MAFAEVGTSGCLDRGCTFAGLVHGRVFTIHAIYRSNTGRLKVWLIHVGFKEAYVHVHVHVHNQSREQPVIDLSCAAPPSNFSLATYIHPYMSIPLSEHVPGRLAYGRQTVSTYPYRLDGTGRHKVRSVGQLRAEKYALLTPNCSKAMGGPFVWCFRNVSAYC